MHSDYTHALRYTLFCTLTIFLVPVQIVVLQIERQDTLNLDKRLSMHQQCTNMEIKPLTIHAKF